MIIKLTLVGLIIVLIAVIALSYYQNKECFEDITNQLNASCTDSCESGIQSKDGSAILIMVKKLNPNTNPDPYAEKERDMITGSLLLKVKSDQGLSTVWRAIPCDKGANPPYTANVSDNGRLVIKNNADKEVWASSKGALKKGSKPYQLVLINKNLTNNGPLDQLRLIDQYDTPVWTASSPDSPDAFKPCDSDPSPSDANTNECKVGLCPSQLVTGMGHFKVMLQHDGILKLQSMIPTIPDRIVAKAKDKGLNGPYTLFLTKYGNLLILDKTNDQRKPVWSSNSYRADGDKVGKYRLVLAEDGSRSVSGPCLNNVLSCRNSLAGEDDRGVRWHVWGMPGSLGQANCTLGKSAFQVMSPVGASTTTRGGASPCCLGARVDGHYFVVAACCRASCVSRGLRRGEWWR